jgi:hypothetical protein
VPGARPQYQGFDPVVRELTEGAERLLRGALF